MIFQYGRSRIKEHLLLHPCRKSHPICKICKDDNCPIPIPRFPRFHISTAFQKDLFLELPRMDITIHQSMYACGVGMQWLCCYGYDPYKRRYCNHCKKGVQFTTCRCDRRWPALRPRVQVWVALQELAGRSKAIPAKLFATMFFIERNCI